MFFLIQNEYHHHQRCSETTFQVFITEVTLLIARTQMKYRMKSLTKRNSKNISQGLVFWITTLGLVPRGIRRSSSHNRCQRKFHDMRANSSIILHSTLHSFCLSVCSILLERVRPNFQLKMDDCFSMSWSRLAMYKN